MAAVPVVVRDTRCVSYIHSYTADALRARQAAFIAATAA
eukprot:COSAG01_NODE_59522_length_299_cov_51.450000_1_plen_38_part_10